MTNGRAYSCVKAVLPALLMATLLSGCVGYTLVKGGERTSIGSSVTVVAPRDWNRRTQDNVDYWTLDGAVLQQLIFVKGVGDDDVLWHTGGDPTKTPKFRKSMNAVEITELIHATMALEKLQNIKFAEVKPSPLGGHPGFSFDFTATTEKGLDLKGTGRAAVIDGKLYMAVYRGAALHFFDRARADYDKIITSIKIGGES